MAYPKKSEKHTDSTRDASVLYCGGLQLMSKKKQNLHLSSELTGVDLTQQKTITNTTRKTEGGETNPFKRRRIISRTPTAIATATATATATIITGNKPPKLEIRSEPWYFMLAATLLVLVKIISMEIHSISDTTDLQTAFGVEFL